MHPVIVRDAYDAAHVDLLVSVQDVLDLCRVDVVSGCHDHPLGTSAEEDEPVLIHVSEVPGVHPGHAVGVPAQRLCCLLRIVQVLLHDSGTGQKDLSLFSVRKLFVGSGFHDLDIGVGEWKSYAPLLGHMYGGQTAGCDRLGGPVAFADLNGRVVVIQELVELLLEFHRQGVTSGEHSLEAAEVSLVQIVQPEQRLIERRHSRDEVAFIFDYVLGVGLCRESGHQHAASAALQHGVYAHPQPEAVEDRHRRQHPVALPVYRVGGHDLVSQRVEVVVGEHYALGGAGGSSGIEYRRGIVRFSLHRVVVEADSAESHELVPADDGSVFRDLLYLPSLGEHVSRHQRHGKLVLDGGYYDIDHAGRVLPYGLEFGIELVQSDDCHAVGEVQVELYLLLSRQRMYHVRHRADQVDGIEHVDALRAVRESYGDMVALSDPDGPESFCASLYLSDHLPVAGVLSHEDERVAVRMFVGGRLYRLKERALRVFQMERDAAQILLPGRPHRSRLFFFSHCSVSFVFFTGLPGRRPC